MTPSQLEHLKLIDVHLERLLKKAESRFPFRWSNYCQDNTNLHGYAVAGIQSEVIACRCTKADAAFIASCAGNAEAGWKTTRSIIDYLLMMHKHGDGYRYIGLTEDILAAFPLKLIQKP